MRMIFTPEQQIFMIEPYFSNGHTLHRFRESDIVQRSARPKVRLGKILRLSNVEDEPQLSLRQLSQQTELSVSTCERIVRKDLEDSVTAERYRNNILDVFTINSNWLKGIFNKTDLQHARLFVICVNFLHLCA
jgi:AraC-like DNA-binding protein